MTAHYLLSLVCERLGLNDRAIEAISKSTEILEALYEQSEDADIERRFVIANVTMGRLRLANGEYQAAIQAFETAGSLLGEALDKDSHTLSTLVQFGGGLAKYQLGDLEGAVALMEAAVGNLPDDAHVLRGHTSLLLAQTLWSLGTDEARTAASGQLLEWCAISRHSGAFIDELNSIAANSEDLAAIVTLASMGLVLLDDSLVEAALSETLALPLHRRFELDPRRDVAHIRAQHLLLLVSTCRAISKRFCLIGAGRDFESARRGATGAASRAQRPYRKNGPRPSPGPNRLSSSSSKYIIRKQRRHIGCGEPATRGSHE